MYVCMYVCMYVILNKLTFLWTKSKTLAYFSARFQDISNFFLVDTLQKVDNTHRAIFFYNFCISSVEFSQKLSYFVAG